MKKLILITSYISAVVIANLLVNKFGSKYSPHIAFVFIGFDLTLRDQIHEMFNTRYIYLKFLPIILVGSLVSYILNVEVKDIAIASGTAFGCAAFTDTFIYQLLYKFDKSLKITISNFFSAIIDSYVFIYLAFGWLPETFIKQSCAKIFGGFIWMGVFYIVYKILLWHRGKKMELSPSSSR